MSYDVDLTCAHCGAYDVYEKNYTSNVAGMLYDAGPWWQQIKDLIDYTGGAPAWQIADLLIPMIDALLADPERFRANNPVNGWGDYDRMLRSWMLPWLRACIEHPELTCKMTS